MVQVPNPNPSVGQFAWVRMWVDKENGTAWQIDGYGADGKLRKRFSITSVQRLSDGTWFFKQMKLEVRNPKNPDRTQALNTAAQTLLTSCATDTFAVSFVKRTEGLLLPEGRGRLYITDALAADAAGIAANAGVANPAINLVFLTELHDTRFNVYSVMRPLSGAH